MKILLLIGGYIAVIVSASTLPEWQYFGVMIGCIMLMHGADMRS